MSKKFFFMSGLKGIKAKKPSIKPKENKMGSPKNELREKARAVYVDVGSIKRTARKMQCSKAEIKGILGKEWLAEKQKERQNAHKKTNKSKTASPKTNASNSSQPVSPDGKRRSFPKIQGIVSMGSNISLSGSISPGARTNQQVQYPSRVVNTDKGTFEVVTAKAWGHGLVPVEDPKAQKVTAEEINSIKLIEGFPKVPADLWTRWIDLCFHFCEAGRNTNHLEQAVHREWDAQQSKLIYFVYKDGHRVQVDNPPQTNMFGFAQANYYSSNGNQLEVSVLLCRKEDDLAQWRMLVPKQSVSSTNVRAEVKECIDIVTGEKFDYFPPEGWLHAGSSHSHNTMDAFFSSTDDGSELSVPGLHIVVGRISWSRNTYTQKASIVLRKLRKHVEFLDVVDAEPVDDVSFHTDVLEYISTSSSWGPNVTKSSNVATPFPQKSSKSIGRGYYDDWEDEDDYALSVADDDRWRQFWQAIDDSDADADVGVGANTLADMDSSFTEWLTKQNKTPKRPPIEELIEQQKLPSPHELLEEEELITPVSNDNYDALDFEIDPQEMMDYFYSSDDDEFPGAHSSSWRP